MLALRDIQQRAYHAIATGQGGRLLPHIVDDKIPARSRIRVYSNNLHETGRKTLVASYPVVQQLTGTPCFRNLAHLYISRFPSRCGDLAMFGAEFPAFLKYFYHDTTFAYLSSVAKLEWACVESEGAADAAPIVVRELSQIDERHLPGLCFDLHPALRLVTTPHCAFSIWKAHKVEDFAGVDARSPGESALIFRCAKRVVVRPIDSPTFAFIGAIKAGGSLLEAQNAAADVAKNFDPASALRDLYGAGLLVGFRHQHHEFRSDGGQSNVTNEIH